MNKDHTILEILKILDCQSEFTLDSWSQINGETLHLTIQENHTAKKNFLYEYKNKRILHFTDLNSAFAILKSQKLRSSNLSSFASKGGDEEELIHALKLTRTILEDYPILKDNIFVSSFTPLDNPNLTGYDYHWETYGNNHKGVAFEFEIIRSPLFPDHFALQVKYLEEVPEKETLLSLLKNTSITRQNVFALGPILASIKMRKFLNEKEVRLVTSLEEDSYKLSYMKDHYEIGLDEDLKINRRNYYLPFSTPKTPEDQILLKLHKIHLGEFSSHNSGATFIHDFLRPLAEEKEVHLV